VLRGDEWKIVRAGIIPGADIEKVLF
jgi:hypothetical protein